MSPESGTGAQGERLGVVLYTHDHIDDARVAMELAHSVWGFGEPSPYIVHAYNGPEALYPEPYLEDELIRRVNLGHFKGAADLIDAGAAAILEREDVGYAVFLATDTWLLSGDYLRTVIADMKADGRRVAAATWGYPEWSNPFENGVAVDFFVIDVAWAREWGLFPLGFAEFEERFGSLFVYLGSANVSVEKLLMTRLQEASFRETQDNVWRMQKAIDRLRLMVEREPVHMSTEDPVQPGARRPEWPAIGLHTQDLIDEKREAMQRAGVQPEAEAAPTISRLLESPDVSWFNAGRG